MSGPWNKYGNSNAEASKPWDRYASSSNPVATPAAEEASNKYSSTRSFYDNLMQNLAFGFGDELEGAEQSTIQSIAEKLGIREEDGKGFWDKYTEERDAYRNKLNEQQEEHPVASGLGTGTGLVATSLIPGLNAAKGATLLQSAGNAGKVGAAVGAVFGAGNSEADLTKGEIGQFAQDVGTSAALSGGISAAMPYAVEGIKSVGTKIASKASDLLKTAAEKSALNATGATANQASKFSKEAGRELLDRGIVAFGDTPGNVAAKAEGAVKQAGSQIDDALTKFDSKLTSIDRDTILSQIKNRIAELQMDPSQGQTIRKLNSLIEDIAAGPKNMSLADAEKTKRGFQALSNYADPVGTITTKETANVYRKAVEDAALAKDKNLAGLFKEGKKSYGLLEPIREAAQRRASQLNQAPVGGLLDIATIGAGGMLGDGEGAATGIGLAALRRGVAPRLSSSIAVSSDALSRIMQKAPETLGRYAAPLQKAAARGAQSFAVTHNLLMQTDPEYRKKIMNHEDKK